MKALVIGGTGPTGPFVVEGLLKRGYQVAILHRGTHEVELPADVEHLHGDPRSDQGLETALGPRNFDVVISQYGRLRHIAQVMVRRTPRIIGITGPIIYMDYGVSDLPIPIPEDAPKETDLVETDPRRKSGYLVGLGERALMEAHKQGLYNATIIRYPSIYGPRSLAPKEWSLIRRILDGRRRLIIPDGGLVLLSRGYCENMAHAVLLAVDKPEKSAGQVYNAREDGIFSLRQWAGMVAKIMGHEWDLISMPSRLAVPAQSYSNMRHHTVLDSTKIKTELGYRDVISSEDGLKRTIEWYRDNPLKPGGEEEQRLRDPFDYPTEDRIIQAFEEGTRRVVDIPFALPNPAGELINLPF